MTGAFPAMYSMYPFRPVYDSPGVYGPGGMDRVGGGDVVPPPGGSVVPPQPSAETDSTAATTDATSVRLAKRMAGKVHPPRCTRLPDECCYDVATAFAPAARAQRAG